MEFGIFVADGVHHVGRIGNGVSEFKIILGNAVGIGIQYEVGQIAHNGIISEKHSRINSRNRVETEFFYVDPAGST